MPSTVYKGDLAEVSFATETGLIINANTDANMTIATVAGNDFTTITFSAQSNAVMFLPAFTATGGAYNNDPTITHVANANIRVGQTVSAAGGSGSGVIPTGATVASLTDATHFELSAATTGGNHTGATLTFTSNALRYPKNMLVGSQVKWTDTASTLHANDKAGFFTIVENDGRTLKITPAMQTGDATLSAAAIDLHILPYKTPPLDVSMSEPVNHTNYPYPATESCKIDQFLGIANAITLPETKVDLKRFHVVGLGRDTSVQVPGKFITEGGSFEVAMHSARWLKYCLGQDLIAENGETTADHAQTTACEAGASHIVIASVTGTFEAGGYIEIEDDTEVPIVSDHEPEGAAWNGTFGDEIFDKAKAFEARRVIGVDGTTLYLDEPLTYSHPAGKTINFRKFGTADTKPPTISSAKVIDQAVTHLIYSRSTLPSFCIEVSQRRRDVDSTEGAFDGGVTDTKELVRVYRGCKVADFSLTTDNDAALRLSVNFNSALCYTDTGRLEASPFPRYSSHRMFDDTASTDVKRLESGIGTNTQKPFMFYNGTINIAGIQAAQVLNFTLTGQTGLQGFHVVNGSSQVNVESATAQVPFGGSRNTSLMVEGKTSYEMTMEVVVDDPIFYHKMRTATDFSVSTEASASNRIVIDFEKSTSTGDTERMMLIIDEYAIIEAPLQIPEDKGAVKSMLKIMPKAIKVIARDTIIKY